jgi:signal transduction histidine kinase
MRRHENHTTRPAPHESHDGPDGQPTAYDARLRHAELVHQLRSVHAGHALSTDQLLEVAPHASHEPGGRPDDPDWRRLLMLQSREVTHLGRLLDAHSVLDPAAEDHGRAHEPLTDLAEVIDLAVGIARLHGQRVTWSGTPVVRRVAARPTREILQVVLDNAREHAPGARVDLEVVEESGTVLVRVHDHGPGLAHPPRVPAAGHGLGLGIAADAAGQMGARLEAEECADGACFVLALPAREDLPDDRAQEGAPPWSGHRA